MGELYQKIEFKRILKKQGQASKDAAPKILIPLFSNRWYVHPSFKISCILPTSPFNVLLDFLSEKAAFAFAKLVGFGIMHNYRAFPRCFVKIYLVKLKIHPTNLYYLP